MNNDNKKEFSLPRGSVIINKEKYPEIYDYFGTDLVTPMTEISTYTKEELDAIVDAGQATRLSGSEVLCRGESGEILIVSAKTVE